MITFIVSWAPDLNMLLAWFDVTLHRKCNMADE